jgi:hypothetical protein
LRERIPLCGHPSPKKNKPFQKHLNQKRLEIKTWKRSKNIGALVSGSVVRDETNDDPERVRNRVPFGIDEDGSVSSSWKGRGQV